MAIVVNAPGQFRVHSRFFSSMLATARSIDAREMQRDSVCSFRRRQIFGVGVKSRIELS